MTGIRYQGSAVGEKKSDRRCYGPPGWWDNCLQEGFHVRCVQTGDWGVADARLGWKISMRTSRFGPTGMCRTATESGEVWEPTENDGRVTGMHLCDLTLGWGQKKYLVQPTKTSLPMYRHPFLFRMCLRLIKTLCSFSFLQGNAQ